MRTRTRALLVSAGVVLLGVASLPLGAAGLGGAHVVFSRLDPLLPRGEAHVDLPHVDPLGLELQAAPDPSSGEVRLRAVLHVPADEEFVDVLRAHGDRAVGLELVQVEVWSGSERLDPVATDAPSVTGDDERVSVTTVSRTPPADTRRPLRITVGSWECEAPACDGTVTVSTTGWTVAAVRPPAGVVEQRSGRVVVVPQPVVQEAVEPTQDDEGVVSFVLLPPAGGGAGVAVPAWAERVVESLAVLGWPLVPWLVLLVRSRGQLRASEQASPRPEWTHRQRARLECLVLLLGLGLVVLWLRMVQLVYESPPVSRWLETALPAYPSDDWGLVNVAIAGALTVWVVAAVANDLLEYDRPRGHVRAVAVVTVLLVAGTALLLAVSWDGGSSSPVLLVGGAGLAVLACVLLARGVSPVSGASAVAAALGACSAVVVAAALVSDSQFGNELERLLAVLVAGAVVVVPTVLVADRGLGLGRAWTAGLFAAAVLVAALIALPSVVTAGEGEDLTPYGVMWGLRGLLQVLLLVVGLALLHGLRGCGSLPRHMVLAFAYVLLLRPDLQYAYVPWSFLVGVVLVHLVLVPARGYPVAPIVRTGAGRSPAEVRSMLLRSSLAAADRSRQDAWLGRLAKGDLDAATEQRLRADPGPPAPSRRPEPAERRQATSWPVSPDPWVRAGAGALAGGVVGVVLQLSYLTEQLSVVSSVVGLGSWAALFLLAVSFQFPLYGLFLGYFLPVVPGSTGLSKAARLFVVLAVVEGVALLVPLEASADLARALLVRLLQLAVLCGVLGVGADLRVLARAGVELSQLRALYGTSRLVIWVAGIVVAVATTVATAMLGSAATLLLEEVQPWVPGTGAAP